MATFRKLNSGKWQARVSRDGKEFSIGTFRTKKEAELEAGKVEERIYYGQTLNDRNMLFDEVATEYLEHKKANQKESTFEQTESIVRNHILPFFKNKRIVSIKRTDIKKWLKHYAGMTKNDGTPVYSFGSRLKHLSILKGIFFHGVHELEILEKNPCDKLRVSVQDRVEEATKTTVKYYSKEELHKIFIFMKNYKHQRFPEYQLYYTLIYFLANTGLRISEALALQWSDIDGDKLTVNKQTRRKNDNSVVITTLKNTSSYRTIKLTEELLKELRRFKLKQNEVFLKYPSFNRSEENIIFQNFLGNYLTPSTVREMLMKYCKQVGVEYKGTHSFRHTHAVMLLESRASIKYVSERLGHKTIKTTSDVYLHITEKIEEDELKKFASYMKFESK